MNTARKRRATTPTRKPTAPTIGAPVPLPRPNVDDPLVEPTRHRRVWAAYLRAGFTRRTFAAALGTNYHTVNRWDAGAAAMSLDMLERAVPLLGFTMDELCFGRLQPAAADEPRSFAVSAAVDTQVAELRAEGRRAEVLSEGDIRVLFDHQRIDPGVRAAFGEHAASPAGRYQSFTAAYVEAWCAAYAQSRSELQALQAAANARAVTEVVTAGVPSVTPEALRAALAKRNGA